MIVHKTLITATLISLLALLGASWAKGGEPTEKKPQTTCPVMGGKINKSLFADYNGWRVYFCCAMCPAKFKADPEKYMKQLQAEGVQLDQTTQTICPVTDEKLTNKDISLVYEGRTIYFCCKECPEIFKKDPAKYLAKLGIKTGQKAEAQSETAPAPHEGHMDNMEHMH